MITIRTDIDSPRLRYVLNFLSEYYGEPFKIGSEDVAIQYGAAPVPGAFFIPASGLLSETGLRTVDPKVAQHAAGFPVLFAEGADFDVFSAVFFLLTRYEEWSDHVKDEYGRYAHKNSVAARYGFLNRPLVHEWLSWLWQQLKGVAFSPVRHFLPTYDIDMAWSYRHKGVVRNFGALIRSVGKPEFARRLAVLGGRSKDPFDAYQKMHSWHRQWNLQPVYFILAALRRGTYDKNIDPRTAAMRRLVKWLSGFYPIGLHPSWQSGDQPKWLPREKRALQKAAGHRIEVSRQHYIRFSFPETFRRLISAGIRDDYSMGYGSINGYRASVSVPFYWYDLGLETQTPLRLHPFCFMDANAYYEQQQDPVQTAAELDHYLQQWQRWGGTLCTIWHNSFLGSAPEFKGWSEVYLKFLEDVNAAG